jgi:hypothetical protein
MNHPRLVGCGPLIHEPPSPQCNRLRGALPAVLPGGLPRRQFWSGRNRGHRELLRQGIRKALAPFSPPTAPRTRDGHRLPGGGLTLHPACPRPRSASGFPRPRVVRPRCRPVALPPVRCLPIRPRLAPLATGQRLIQGRDVLIPAPAVLLQAPQDRPLEVGGNSRPDRGERRHRLVDVGEEQLQGGRLPERGPAGQQEVRDRPQAVDIAPPVQPRRPLGLLRGQVLGRAGVAPSCVNFLPPHPTRSPPPGRSPRASQRRGRRRGYRRGCWPT